ncbi:MAG: hypothetical protein CBD25_001405 [Candidatus Pelagibacter sp. TMED165]|nr:MAG: hypothetical protein CBD25_001405 [Candidatus Pelagibacter sp. TMED165]|tara:strand:- start:478 stop:978 length:501 start_codon:yes stop_codon:yes gene_type:complete
MVIKKVFFIFFFIVFTSSVLANIPRSIGKYKNWESYTIQTDKGKVCFAQTKPVKRSPGSIKRKESRIFVSFRPNENIKDEISVTSGHDYKTSSVTGKSGKNNFSFFSQNDFAWLLDEKEEKSLIKIMKRATSLMIIAKTTDGAETTDHYSMMGFTKAYNTAKKVCN